MSTEPKPFESGQAVPPKDFVESSKFFAPEVDFSDAPDHLQLPESDGTFVKNFQEHPQSLLLTDSIKPWLEKRYPDGQYCIGQDSGIYWSMHANPPQRGAEAPDWFLVLGVPPELNGTYRRSYVMWKEVIAPLIALEFVSGDGSEERDTTPHKGKFWIYEQAIRIPFYGIFEVSKNLLEMHHLVEGQYEPLPPNERGHYPIKTLGVEIGLWHGRYINLESPWLRWWDEEGNLLPTGDERAEKEHKRAETERQAKEEALKQLEHLKAYLRASGVNPDEVV